MVDGAGFVEEMEAIDAEEEDEGGRRGKFLSW